MYKRIDPKEKDDFFTKKYVDLFFHKIFEHAIETFGKNPKISEEKILGSFILNGIHLKNKNKLNVYVEYTFHMIPNGSIDIKIIDLVIFDEIPDFILDRANDIIKSGRQSGLVQ